MFVVFLTKLQVDKYLQGILQIVPPKVGTKHCTAQLPSLIKTPNVNNVRMKSKSMHCKALA